jgi:hypothetical protein
MVLLHQGIAERGLDTPQRQQRTAPRLTRKRALEPSASSGLPNGDTLPSLS